MVGNDWNAPDLVVAERAAAVNVVLMVRAELVVIDSSCGWLVGWLVG